MSLASFAPRPRCKFHTDDPKTDYKEEAMTSGEDVEREATQARDFHSRAAFFHGLINDPKHRIAKDAHARQAAKFAARVDRQKRINRYSLSSNEYAFRVNNKNMHRKRKYTASGKKARFVVRVLKSARASPLLAGRLRNYALKNCPLHLKCGVDPFTKLHEDT